MNVKKYLKPFWHRAKAGEQIVRHLRRFGFFNWGGLTKVGLLRYLISAIVTIGVVGTVAAQAPEIRFSCHP